MRVRGPWSKAEIDRHLTEAVLPLRLACLSRSWPVVLSLWFLYRDGALWCAVHRTSRVYRRLAADGRCAFEVASDDPPYRGVRGQGRATLHPEDGAMVLEALLVRYQGGVDTALGRWLLGRADGEVAVRIAPTWLASWDYAGRMRG